MIALRSLALLALGLAATIIAAIWAPWVLTVLGGAAAALLLYWGAEAWVEGRDE